MAENENRTEMGEHNEQHGEGGGASRPRNRRPRGGRNRGGKKHDPMTRAAEAASEETAAEAAGAAAEKTPVSKPTGDGEPSAQENKQKRSRGRRGGRNRRGGADTEQTAAHTEETDAGNTDAEIPGEPEYVLTERDEIAAQVHEVITEERLDALAEADADMTDAGADAAEESEVSPKTPVEIVGVRFKAAGKVYYFDPDGASYRENDEAAGLHVFIRGDVRIKKAFVNILRNQRTGPQQDGAGCGNIRRPQGRQGNA